MCFCLEASNWTIFICWITDFTINTCSQHGITLINNKAFIFLTIVFLMLKVFTYDDCFHFQPHLTLI